MDLKACTAVRDNMGQARLTNNSVRSGAFGLPPWRANEYVILDRNDLYREDVTAMSCVLMATCPRARPSGFGSSSATSTWAYPSRVRPEGARGR